MKAVPVAVFCCFMKTIGNIIWIIFGGLPIPFGSYLYSLLTSIV